MMMIKMQRNLSRKWSQRDVEKKINYNAISTDRDVLAGGASSPLGNNSLISFTYNHELFNFFYR